MKGLVVFCLAALMTSAPSGSSAGQKAAKAIWKHSKKWKLAAKRPGSTKDKLEIKMLLTGRLKGKVAEFRAELKTAVDGRRCTLRFAGSLGKGSYYFVKSTPVVGGELAVALTGANCKLPEDFKEKFKIPNVALRMFLTGARLCPGIGGKPMTTKNCFSAGR